MSSLEQTRRTDKLTYIRPELIEKGRVAELTQNTVKAFGLSDGFVLLNDNNPLKNLS